MKRDKIDKKKEQVISIPDNTKSDSQNMNDHVKTFIMENIRIIDYHDLAKLIKMKPEELKKILGEMGIKLPVEHARKWKDINVGTYSSLLDCAKCQVQLYHHSFFIGEKNCRKCYEKNIPLWVKEKMNIQIEFSEKM